MVKAEGLEDMDRRRAGIIASGSAVGVTSKRLLGIGGEVVIQLDSGSDSELILETCLIVEASPELSKKMAQPQRLRHRWEQTTQATTRAAYSTECR